MKFSVILADPPWDFKTHSDKGRDRCPSYPTLSLQDICDLPVKQIAADDCALFLWTTGPHMEQAFKVIKAWGFTYSTVAFVWAKQNPSGRGWHSGTGYSTRSNAEYVLLGRKGNLYRVNRSVQQLVVSPRMTQHSRKPDEVHHRIVDLLGDKPRVELFARREVFGWECVGGDLTGRDIREDLALLAGQ